MRLTLQQIKEASQCFRYFRYNLEAEKVESKKLKIARDVIRKSHTQATNTTFRPNWRTIVGWVDKHVFSDVDVHDDDSFRAGKTEAEHLLKFLGRWYKEILLSTNSLAYAGLTLEGTVSDSVVLASPTVVILQEKPIILEVNEVVRSSRQLYNDISVRGQAWLLAEALECETVAYHELAIGVSGGYEEKKIFMTKEDHERTEEFVFTIERQLRAGNSLPSVTTMCETCSFNSRCKL